MFSGTGYAEAARNAVLALIGARAAVKADPTGFAATTISFVDGVIQCRRDVVNKAMEFPFELRNLIEQSRRVDISESAPLVIHAPSVRYEEFLQEGRKVIGYTAWETERMPDKWVSGCNLVDEIWIPSFHNLQALNASGVTTPIYVVPHPIDTERFSPSPLRLNNCFTFVSVFRWGLRKGWPELFTAYERAFTADDPVTLRVLTNYRSEEYRQQAATLAAHFSQHGKPRVEFLPLEYVTYDFLPLLYQNADVFVLPSRGEGFCLPCAEAMACGLPAIVTDCTAFKDYVSSSNGYPVECEQVTSDDPTDPDRAASAWYVANIDDLGRQMRRAYGDAHEREIKSRRARATVEAKFGFQRVANTMIERLAANGG